MKNLTAVKNDIEFYRDFAALIEVLKAIAVFQFHSLQRKIKVFGEFLRIVESFVPYIDLDRVRHPFLNPPEGPHCVIAVTSESGLLGGLNNKVIAGAISQIRNSADRMIVIGQQGQNLVRGTSIQAEPFGTVSDENRAARAIQLRNRVFEYAMKMHFASVKIVHPVAVSISVQRVMLFTLLPCTGWAADASKGQKALTEEVLFESSPGDLIEYLSYFWIGYKLFEILQMSRLAEYAARVIHLEESTQKIKEINQKLRLQYARACHEIVDQQMRELFTARSLFAK